MYTRDNMHKQLYCHVWGGTVTNNCGFWIWWLGLFDVCVTVTLNYKGSHFLFSLVFWLFFRLHFWTLRLFKVKVKVMLRSTVSRPVCLGTKHPFGVTTRSWLFSDSCGFVDLGRPLWREDGSAVCNYYWFSPAQSFLCPSPIGLVATFYCLD
jgi:hypothetical protein